MGMFKKRVRVSNSKDPSQFFEEEFWVDTGALYSFIPEDRLENGRGKRRFDGTMELSHQIGGREMNSPIRGVRAGRHRRGIGRPHPR